ncbi:unnamed protein product [Lampetra planeri]
MVEGPKAAIEHQYTEITEVEKPNSEDEEAQVDEGNATVTEGTTDETVTKIEEAVLESKTRLVYEDASTTASRDIAFEQDTSLEQTVEETVITREELTSQGESDVSPCTVEDKKECESLDVRISPEKISATSLHGHILGGQLEEDAANVAECQDVTVLQQGIPKGHIVKSNEGVLDIDTWFSKANVKSNVSEDIAREIEECLQEEKTLIHGESGLPDKPREDAKETQHPDPQLDTGDVSIVFPPGHLEVSRLELHFPEVCTVDAANRDCVKKAVAEENAKSLADTTDENVQQVEITRDVVHFNKMHERVEFAFRKDVTCRQGGVTDSGFVDTCGISDDSRQPTAQVSPPEAQVSWSEEEEWKDMRYVGGESVKPNLLVENVLVFSDSGQACYEVTPRSKSSDVGMDVHECGREEVELDEDIFERGTPGHHDYSTYAYATDDVQLRVSDTMNVNVCGEVVSAKVQEFGYVVVQHEAKSDVSKQKSDNFEGEFLTASGFESYFDRDLTFPADEANVTFPEPKSEEEWEIVSREEIQKLSKGICDDETLKHISASPPQYSESGHVEGQMQSVFIDINTTARLVPAEDFEPNKQSPLQHVFENKTQNACDIAPGTDQKMILTNLEGLEPRVETPHADTGIKDEDLSKSSIDYFTDEAVIDHELSEDVSEMLHEAIISEMPTSALSRELIEAQIEEVTPHTLTSFLEGTSADETSFSEPKRLSVTQKTCKDAGKAIVIGAGDGKSSNEMAPSGQPITNFQLDPEQEPFTHLDICQIGSQKTLNGTTIQTGFQETSLSDRGDGVIEVSQQQHHNGRSDEPESAKAVVAGYHEDIGVLQGNSRALSGPPRPLTLWPCDTGSLGPLGFHEDDSERWLGVTYEASLTAMRLAAPQHSLNISGGSSGSRSSMVFLEQQQQQQQLRQLRQQWPGYFSEEEEEQMSVYEERK